MTDNGNAAHGLSPAERRALGRHVAEHRRRIIEAWTETQFDTDRLQRWQVAGVDQQDRVTFQRGFLEPLLHLLAGWLTTGEPGWRALYRDERLRYAPHQAPPAERARFFGEILAADEGAVLT